MQFEAKLTLDGLMTLVAGIIAFGAVIIQIRSSSKQLHDQLKAQRDSEREESERQKRAVAAALLVEIDDFYEYFLRNLWEGRERIRGAIEVLNMPPLELGPIPSTAFVMYRATAHRVGILSIATAKSVVGLYNFMAGFVDTYESYRRAWSPERRAADPEMETKSRDIFDLVPKLILDSYGTCEKLSKEQTMPFENSACNIAQIGRCSQHGTTVKQTLQGEAARISQRVSKEGVPSHRGVRPDEIVQNEH